MPVPDSLSQGQCLLKSFNRFSWENCFVFRHSVLSSQSVFRCDYPTP